MPSISLPLLQQLAQRIGLNLLGITSVAPLCQAEKALTSWQEKGFAADMEYMRRSPQLLAHPAALLPSARSAAVFCVPYSHAPHPPLPHGHGRVARYAWGRDYHKVLRKRLAALIDALRVECGETPEHRIFTDAVPLLERELGRSAGIGFVGKNTMLIRPKLGSYFFIAEILWNVEVREHTLSVVAEDCGACRRCLDRCPTQAFPDAYTLNAGRCISYLTIEKRGMLEEWEREALGEWVFGCDVCQDVCPFNHRALRSPISAALDEFDRSAGVGPSLELGSILAMRSQTEFEKRFGGTALTRAKREGMLRNAAIAAANTACVELWPNLLQASSGDSSAVVRAHALWALWKLAQQYAATGRKQIVDRLRAAQRDESAAVRNEANRLILSVEQL